MSNLDTYNKGPFYIYKITHNYSQIYFLLNIHCNFSEESDDYDSDETVQPDIDYYNDDLSDNDGYVSNGKHSGQHEAVQQAQILHIPSR